MVQIGPETTVLYSAVQCTTMHKTVLQCTKQLCIALLNAALHCTLQHCMEQVARGRKAAAGAERCPVSWPSSYCTALLALHCSAATALLCNVLQSNEHYYTALHYTALQCTDLHCSVCNVLQSTELVCITLHFTALATLCLQITVKKAFPP